MPFDAMLLKERICAACGYSEALAVTPYPSDRLTVEGKDGKISIGYSSVSDYCRGIALAIGHLREGEKCFREEQKRRIRSSGVMLDCSYEGMLTVKALKQYVDYMAAVGLNLLMLYTEDTYEVQKYPQMGYQRGRYTQAELRELDSYALEMGVELVGCIQTLGHMSQVVKWEDFADITESESLLLPGRRRPMNLSRNA